MVPIIAAGRLYGVIDLDSQFENRFDDGDAHFVCRIAELVASLS